MHAQIVTNNQAYSKKKKIRVLLSGINLIPLLPITSSDAQPLSCKRLVGAKAIELGS